MKHRRGVAFHQIVQRCVVPGDEACHVRPVAVSEASVMACLRCKDGTETITEKPTKTGAKANTYAFARHECPGCKNTLAINGHGKSATGTVAHTCQLSRAEGGSLLCPEAGELNGVILRVPIKSKAGGRLLYRPPL